MKIWGPRNIKSEQDSILGESALSIAAVKVAGFKRGRSSCEDEFGPNEVPTPEMVQKLLKIVLNGSSLEVRELPNTIGISKKDAQHVLTENFEMRKLCKKEEAPHAAKGTLKGRLALFQRNKE
ncbi:hypothetical protein WA026_005726 [Henosepilachna vigintioctopunctata]|uniref:Uncharacterized protein n=1 Tax=Henosepilachna vigintioctopunctata TaxID=420089 RepID=A0AAW1U431_9CUCU